MNDAEIFAHVQAVARFYLAWCGSLTELCGLLTLSMGKPLDVDSTSRLLRRGHVQLHLQNRYEVAVWRAPDGEFRLVSLALPGDCETAQRRLAHRPPDPGNMCAWCFLDERKHAARAPLVPELDVRSNPVPGVRLHPQCVRAWRHLRVLAESTEATA